MVKRKINYKKKCDELWAIRVKQRAGFRCEVCGKPGEFVKSHPEYPIKGLDAHHMLGKSGVRTKYRHDLLTGMCLCDNHHKYDNACSGHANTAASDNLMLKLQTIDPDRWTYITSHSDDKQGASEKIDYESVYESLQASLMFASSNPNGDTIAKRASSSLE